MITLKNVKKKFDNHEIIYSDYILEDGKSYIILGASGSGKSTLLNMIAGVTFASDGEIMIDNVNIVAETQKVRDDIRTHKIGYIYQDFKLIEDMSVEDNIRVLEICGIKSKNLFSIAEELEIADKMKRRVKTLSGGEKQRVAIARVLVKEPDIILADEPTGSLHYEISDVIIKKLIEITNGKTLIVVSHDTRLVQYFDTVIELNRGRNNV